MKPFTQFIYRLYQDCASQLPAHQIDTIQSIREKSLEVFLQKELPAIQNEAWKNHTIEQVVEPEYEIQLQPNPYRPVEDYFKCNVQNIDTYMFTFLNGWYVHQNAPLTVFPNGIMVGSLFAALNQVPNLVLPYLAKQSINHCDSLIALNQIFFNDGIFIYIPDNLSVSKPMQIVSLVDTDKNLMIHNHHVIVLGKNSTLSLVQCDDSLHFGKTFINHVTEIFLAEGSQLNYTKLENKDSDSLLVNHVFATQEQNSLFNSNVITFNAGFLKNSIHVDLTAPHASTNLYGLYLVDKKQYIDNQVFVNHQAPDCKSYQLYKGIADDEAKANFNGHILVQKGAQRTEAFQTNRNITLTNEAKITTKPFLEIYADDVKCSHGATIGQLDDEALFYLRSRGICERNSRMLLMYAFANEVAEFVMIDSLRQRLNDMIKKRLNGELSICDQCVLHCSDEKHFNFEIDISKI